MFKFIYYKLRLKESSGTIYSAATFFVVKSGIPLMIVGGIAADAGGVPASPVCETVAGVSLLGLLEPLRLVERIVRILERVVLRGVVVSPATPPVATTTAAASSTLILRRGLSKQHGLHLGDGLLHLENLCLEGGHGIIGGDGVHLKGGSERCVVWIGEDGVVHGRTEGSIARRRRKKRRRRRNRRRLLDVHCILYARHDVGY